MGMGVRPRLSCPAPCPATAEPVSPASQPSPAQSPDPHRGLPAHPHHKSGKIPAVDPKERRDEAGQTMGVCWAGSDRGALDPGGRPRQDPGLLLRRHTRRSRAFGWEACCHLEPDKKLVSGGNGQRAPPETMFSNNRDQLRLGLYLSGNPGCVKPPETDGLQEGGERQGDCPHPGHTPLRAFR